MLAGVSSFQETNGIGHDGETIVRHYFEKQGYKVADLTGDPDWQASDVDIQIEMPDGSLRYMEIKTDTEMWKTGNIFLELSMERRNSGTVSEGWFTYSLANDLCYLCCGTSTLYVIPFEPLREYVRSGFGRFVRFKNPIDDNTIGTGVLVNIRELRHAGLIAQEARVNAGALWKHQWQKPPPF